MLDGLSVYVDNIALDRRNGNEHCGRYKRFTPLLQSLFNVICSDLYERSTPPLSL